MNRHAWKRGMAAALLAGLFLAGCKPPQEQSQPPAPEVAVVTVRPQSVVLTTELPGRTASYLVAEIRPQVNGLLQKRLFTEGAEVKMGDILYKIDRAPYEAAVANATANFQAMEKAADRARAALAASTAGIKRQQATLVLAKSNRGRYEELFKTRAVAAMQRDEASTEADVADASLRAAEAQLESDREAVGAAEAAIKQAAAALDTAKINLSYTEIASPISGRIGKSHVTEGAIVTAYQPVALATVQQFDPIYVDVPQSTVQLNRLRRSLANGRLKENGTDRVKIVLEDGTAYAQQGSLKFRDVTVDPTTGSVILRVVVPNPDLILLPGMFVRAVIDQGVQERAILIPQQAVSRDPKGNPTVRIVGAEGKVEQRVLTTERAMGNQWLVSSGLSGGERVIVEGGLKARPGTIVTVVPFAAEPSRAAKPATSAQAATH